MVERGREVNQAASELRHKASLCFVVSSQSLSLRCKFEAVVNVIGGFSMSRIYGAGQSHSLGSYSTILCSQQVSSARTLWMLNDCVPGRSNFGS